MKELEALRFVSDFVTEHGHEEMVEAMQEVEGALREAWKEVDRLRYIVRVGNRQLTSSFAPLTAFAEIFNDKDILAACRRALQTRKGNRK